MSLRKLVRAVVAAQAKAKRFMEDTFVPKLQGAPCQVTSQVHSPPFQAAQYLPYNEQ